MNSPGPSIVGDDGRYPPGGGSCQLSFLPGRGLLWTAVALAVLSAVVWVYPPLWLLLAVGWVLSAALAAWDVWRLRVHAGQVSARMVVPRSCQRGQTIEARLHLSNLADVPQRVRVRPLLPAEGQPQHWETSLRIRARSRSSLHCPVDAGVRGDYVFGDIYLRVVSALQMAQAQARAICSQTTKVLPDIASVEDYLSARRVHGASAPHLRTARLRGIGSEFEGLREYEEGDDIRRIDWRATAKHSRPITRNYEIEPCCNVVLVLDCGRLMAAPVGNGTKLDLAMDAALLTAGVVLDSGDRCGLLVFDREVREYLAPRPRLGQLSRIVEALYSLQPTLDESHFQRAFVYLQKKLLKRGLVIVISDTVDVDVSGSMLRSLVALGRRHLVLLAALRTPEVREVITAPARSTLDPFKKAVAYRLVKERGQALASLRRAGIHVLDVLPQQLTAPLIDKYIQLREKNLL